MSIHSEDEEIQTLIPPLQPSNRKAKKSKLFVETPSSFHNENDHDNPNLHFPSSKPSRPPLGINSYFVKSLSNLICISNQNLFTISLIILLLCGTLGQTYVISLTGDVTGGFYQAIYKRDRNDFFNVLWLSGFVVMGSAILDAFNLLVQEGLAWRWRKKLCLYVHQKYFVHHLFYKVIQLDNGRIDNPDQRITQDINNFSTTLSTTLFKCISAPAILLYYTWKTSTFIVWFAPFIVAGFFLLGYILNKIIMTPIVKLVFEQEKLEGDFRSDHMRIRDCSEAIAIYSGEAIEQRITEETFKRVLKNKLRLLLWQFPLNTSTNTFSYFGAIVNYLIVAIPTIFMSNSDTEVEPKYVAAASFYCIMLVSGFSQFINISSNLSDLAGYTARISELLSVLSELNIQDHLESTIEESGESIEFRDVAYFTPSGIKLAENLNLAIHPGQSLLIQGASGCGKSSLLRCLNGLWSFFEGSITKPVSTSYRMSLFYLPQTPYLFPNGTLIHQVVYPFIEEMEQLTSLQEEQIIQLLESIGLSSLLQNHGSERILDWRKILSPGQQQLISFARILYHKPKFAILDESTSSLPEEVEEKLYQRCQEKEITVVSVGHRSTLKKYHQTTLVFDEKSKQWVLRQKRSEN